MKVLPGGGTFLFRGELTLVIQARMCITLDQLDHRNNSTY
jgi:hypothetical protein